MFDVLTFGQSSVYEFDDWKLSRRFYNIIMQGLPIVVTLTLTGIEPMAKAKVYRYTKIEVIKNGQKKNDN